MFDVGFWELLVIAGLGLLILGPERLPRVVGQLGRWLRQARRTASQLRWQIEHELDLSERRDAERKREETKRAAGTPGADTPTATAASSVPPQGHHGGPASDADQPADPADAAPVSPAPGAFPHDPGAPDDVSIPKPEVTATGAARTAGPADASPADERKDAARSS